jgi:hypothetical protein
VRPVQYKDTMQKPRLIHSGRGFFLSFSGSKESYAIANHALGRSLMPDQKQAMPGKPAIVRKEDFIKQAPETPLLLWLRPQSCLRIPLIPWLKELPFDVDEPVFSH